MAFRNRTSRRRSSRPVTRAGPSTWAAERAAPSRRSTPAPAAARRCSRASISRTRNPGAHRRERRKRRKRWQQRRKQQRRKQQRWKQQRRKQRRGGPSSSAASRLLRRPRPTCAGGLARGRAQRHVHPGRTRSPARAAVRFRRTPTSTGTRGPCRRPASPTTSPSPRSGDADILMWKWNGSSWNRIQNSSATEIAATSSGPGNYVVAVRGLRSRTR